MSNAILGYPPPTASSHSDNGNDLFQEYMNALGNVGELVDLNGAARMTGHCGDSIGVHVLMDKHVLKNVRVQPDGCVYTLVCAKAMTVLALGLSVDEILKLDPQDIAKELGGLPEDHIHCARLALNALGEAIADSYARLINKNEPGEK